MVLIALIVIAGVVNYLDRNTLSIANTTIANDLGFNTLQMGLLLSAFSWPYAIANLPAGYLVDKYGAQEDVRLGGGHVVRRHHAHRRRQLVRSSLRDAGSARHHRIPFFTSGLKVAARGTTR